MPNKILCPKCGSENKELYMTHGQIAGHRWICKDCGKVFEDKVTINARKKTLKVLLIILGSSILILLIMILLIMLAS